MNILQKDIENLIDKLTAKDQKKLRNKLDNLISAYPFNRYEYIISHLMGASKLTLNDYLEIRDEYIARNKYLSIFEISAPRSFGEEWAEEHLKTLMPKLQKPTKKLDQNYSGQYDFLYQTPGGQKIKIEVKASRAVDFDSHEPLYIKALAWEPKSPFDMNFQQIKPSCCDIFVWVGVWRDTIKYWVLASREVEKNKYYSKGQHRGNVGEGQLHLKHDNIKEFKKFITSPKKLQQTIIEAFTRQKSE